MKAERHKITLKKPRERVVEKFSQTFQQESQIFYDFSLIKLDQQTGPSAKEGQIEEKNEKTIDHQLQEKFENQFQFLNRKSFKKVESSSNSSSQDIVNKASKAFGFNSKVYNPMDYSSQMQENELDDELFPLSMSMTLSLLQEDLPHEHPGHLGETHNFSFNEKNKLQAINPKFSQTQESIYLQKPNLNQPKQSSLENANRSALNFKEKIRLKIQQIKMEKSQTLFQSSKKDFESTNSKKPNKVGLPIENKKKYQIVKDRIQSTNQTTIMIQNIPNKYTKDLLIELVNKRFQGKYDFFYLPIDIKFLCNVGYAFINFVDLKSLENFYVEFHNKKWPMFNSEKICHLSYA